MLHVNLHQLRRNPRMSLVVARPPRRLQRVRPGAAGQQRRRLGRYRCHRDLARLCQRQRLGRSHGGGETRNAPAFQRRDEGGRRCACDVDHDLDALDVLWDV